MPDHITLDTLTSALGWGVLHFLWQGALFGAIAAMTLASLRGHAAQVRYAVACAALVGCMLAFLATFTFMLLPPALDIAPIPHAAASADPTASPGLLINTVAWLWVGGVVFFFVRFALQWLAAQRLRTIAVSQPDDYWLGVFDTIKTELAVRRTVRLLRSGLAEAPMVVGWISPVVLVPVSAFTSMTPDQLRSVLVHELSHIRRHDHVVNGVQVVIETALFFHPVVWWLSSRARLEREHCCDDAAVLASGNPRVFAEALTQLEALRNAHPQAALAVNGGSLMNRVARILETRPDRRPMSSHWRTVVALTAGAVVAAAGLAQAAVAGGPKAQSDDPIADVLRDAVAIGLSQDQARSIYDAVVFPGSDVQRKIEAELAMITERIDAAVADGDLSREDAAAKLKAVREGVAEQQDMAFSMDVLGMTHGDAYLAARRAHLDRLVEAGELTDEIAERKMAGIERKAQLRVQYGEYMEQAATEIRERVAAGDLTEEEADAKIAEMKEAIGKRMWFHAASEDIKAAERAGEITRDEAGEKIEALKARISGGRDGDRAREGERDERPDWDGIHRRIEGAVERGDLTREEADAKYLEIRRRMARDDDRADRGGRPDWDAIRARIEGAVERGDLTREEADVKYREIRQRMARDDDRADRGGRPDWDAIRARIEGAVERGDLTREEADVKYREIRQRMARDGDRAREGDRAERPDWDGIHRRIEGAVERGDMTREQADTMYRALRQRMANRERGDR